MIIQALYTRIEENLSTAAKLDDCIYYIKNKTLFSINVYTTQKILIKEDISCNFLISIRTDLILIDGNKVCVINKTGEILKIHHLCSPIKIVKKYKDKIIILTDQHIFYRLEYSKLITIRSSKIPKNLIINDFEVTKNKSFILDQKNEIYIVNCLSTCLFITYNEKLNMMEYNQNKICTNIDIRENKYYLQFENGFVIYKRRDNMLLPFFEFKNKDYKLFFTENIYLISKGVFLLKNSPEKIIAEDALFIFDNYVICSDCVYVLSNSYTDNKKLIPYYEAETNYIVRTKKLFSNIKLPKLGERKLNPDEIKHEDVLALMKDIYDFKRNHLDTLNIIFRELNTLCNSFEEKFSVIEMMKQVAEKKSRSVNEKKNTINEKMLEIYIELEKILNSKILSGDLNEVNHRIENCKRQMLDGKISRDEHIIERLKLQRMILRNATE